MSKPFSFGAIDVRLDSGSEPRPAHAGDDAPFRVLLAGDFSGRGSRGLAETGSALGERKVFRVDLDSLDATIARLEPQVRLRDGDVLRLRELDDFLPDALFSRIGRFGALRDAARADAARRSAASRAASSAMPTSPRSWPSSIRPPPPPRPRRPGRRSSTIPRSSPAAAASCPRSS